MFYFGDARGIKPSESKDNTTFNVGDTASCFFVSKNINVLRYKILRICVNV